MGSRLPEGVEVRAMEESADTIYLVLPLRSADLQTGELSDEALEEVVAGALGQQPARTPLAQGSADRLVGLGAESKDVSALFLSCLRLGNS